MSAFAQPAAPGEGIQLKDHLGALLLIDVISLETGIATTFGDADAIKADVSVIDGPGSGTDYSETLIFPKVLQSQLKRSVGQKVLGRLGQGQAKPGQSAPWVLNEASAEDIAKGEAFLAARTQPTITSAQAPF